MAVNNILNLNYGTYGIWSTLQPVYSKWASKVKLLPDYGYLVII